MPGIPSGNSKAVNVGVSFFEFLSSHSIHDPVSCSIDSCMLI